MGGREREEMEMGTCGELLGPQSAMQVRASRKTSAECKCRLVRYRGIWDLIGRSVLSEISR